MRIELKVKDVEGMTDEKRHVFIVDNEEFKRCIMQHPEFFLQEIVKQEFIQKHHTKALSMLINDVELRNTIYMQEKQRREQRAENRQRMKQAEIDKQRRREQFIASKNYRQSVDYIHNVLGWNDKEENNGKL